MKTITEQLADALRVVSAGSTDYENLQEIARNALASYEAQQAQAHDVAAGAWSANAGSVWDHTGKWIADCNSEHAARIVLCVNAHDALVSALREASRALCELDALGERHDAALIDDALAQARVTPP